MSKEGELAKNKAIREFVADQEPYTEEGKQLIIRTGEAEEIDKPIAVVINGTISAPSKFFASRKELHDPLKCHVLVDKLEGSIELIFDENSKYGHHITGKLENNPELLNFRINEKKMFTIKDLMDLLKFNRVFFVDKDDNSKVVTQLQMFKVKVTREFEEANNNRGTQRKVNNSELEHSLNENFKLKMPIYKGEEDKTFVVDICVSVADSGDVLTWLESRDLKELQVSERERLLNEQVANFGKVVVIEV